MNPEPLRHLCDTFNAAVPVYYRPRNEKSVERRRLSPDERTALIVVAFIVEQSDLKFEPADRDWAVGIVAKNPFYPKRGARKRRVPEGWPHNVEESELIICDLRSWHSMSNPKKRYRLWSYETASTSDALAFRPVADWDDDASDDKALPGIPATRRSVRLSRTGARAGRLQIIEVPRRR
jgi:hypothetical protein